MNGYEIKFDGKKNYLQKGDEIKQLNEQDREEIFFWYNIKDGVIISKRKEKFNIETND